MIEKTEILFVILGLLLSFYLVIHLGAKVGKKTSTNLEISKYLFGVRILISLIAIVSLILWFFM